MLEYRLLGRFEVRADGRLVDLGTPKQRAVLAILLLEGGRVVPTDRLLDLLWGDAATSAGALQSYISNLRRALEPARRPRDPAAVLVTEAPGYRVVATRESVDLTRFEDLVTRGSDRVRRGDAAGGLADLDDALSSWHGPPLPELADEPFVLPVTARLSGLRVTALGLAAQARLDLGDHHGAVALLEGPVAEHALDERLHGLLALALYRAGRQVDALRVVERVRRALVDDVGLDPGPELRALESDLLAQSPSLDWSPPTPPPSTAPPTTTSSSPTPSSPGSASPAPSSPVSPSVPAPPRATPAGPTLVGRSQELQALVGALDAVEAGRGGAAVVMGEAGIGKTRLVEELMEVARARGFVTASVRCAESGVPSFWPAISLADQVRQAGSITAGISPPDESAPVNLFAMYEAVARGLRDSSDPLVVVFDDLQWADTDTMRLVAHVAPGLRDAPVLVVAIVRPIEDDAPALVDCLAALTRSPDTVHLQLGGLALDDVAEWLGRRSGVDVSREVAATVHERTGGHPLFVKELSELLSAEGRLNDVEAVRANRAIPPGVQFVVRRRVARLPDATQQLLSVASVVGRSFSLDVVSTVLGIPLDAALDALAPALDAGLVIDDGTAELSFSHALVAEALVAELNATRRARLHAATARAIGERAGPGFGDSAALVAHHAMEGRLAGTGELAIEASVVAARRAVAGFGYEEASAHWERVVRVLESLRPGDRESRLDALCELASVRFQADLVRPAKEATLAAVALAEELGDLSTMTRVAALLGRPHLWPNQAYGEVDHQAVTALERVIERLPDDDLVSRALVLGALAVELIYDAAERSGPVRAAAEEAARACGDPAVLARVLINVAGPLRPSELDQREAIAHEVLALSDAHGLPEEIELVGWFHLAIARWDRADFDAAIGHIETCRRLADRIGGSTVRAQLTWYRGATALVRGEYDVAIRLGDEAGALYRRTRRIDADLIESTLLLAVAADRGGVEPILDRLMAVRTDGNYDWVTAFAVAWGYAEMNRLDDAAAVLGLIDPRRPWPDDYTTLCGAAMAVHAYADLGDADSASTMAAGLEPYRGRWTQAGSGGCSGGLVDLALARAAATAGDDARARELFAVAVATLESVRAPAWLARALLHQSRFLLSTGRPDDDAAARAALGGAADLAERHGLVYVQRRIMVVRDHEFSGR